MRFRRTVFVSAAAAAASLAPHAAAMAQEWPEAGIVATLGLADVGGRAALGMTAGLTHSWGPIVGSVAADVAIFAYSSRPGTHADPVNGTLYCGNRPLNSVDTVCEATLDAAGGVLVDAGVSLEPLLPVTVGAGHRFGPVEESCATVTIHGPTSREPLRWVVRGVIGRGMSSVQAGIAINLDLIHP